MNETLEVVKVFFADKWITLASIVVLFFSGKLLLRFLVKKAISFANDGNDDYESQREKQAKTLGQLILHLGNIVIFLVIILMVL